MAERITCPKCKWLTDPGRFCEHCGARIDAAEDAGKESAPATPSNGAAAQEAAEQEAASEHNSRHATDVDDIPGEFESEKPGKPTGGKAETMSDRGTPATQQVSEADAPRAGDGDFTMFQEENECEDLWLELDESVILVKNMRSTFNVRLNTRENQLENVTLKVYPVGASQDDSGMKYRFPGRRSRLRGGSTKKAHVPFTPKFHGQNAFRIRVDYTKEGQKYSFESDETRQMVYKEDDAPSQVINQVKTNVENKGHAADVPVENTLNYYEDLQNSGSLNINNVLQEAEKAPAAWIPVPLYDAGAPPPPRVLPEGPPPADAQRNRLTLYTQQQRVHLLAGKQFTLGKRRVEEDRNTVSNDIVTRVFNSQGEATKALNRKISKYHCHIRFEKESCTVVDEGLLPDGTRKTNVWGTYLDGNLIGESEKVALPMDKDFTLTLAGEDANSEDVVAFTGRVLTCELHNTSECPSRGSCDKDAPVCVVLSPVDNRPETFVLTRGHVPLGAVDAALRKARVWRAQNAFALQAGGDKDWLAPGKEFSVPGNGTITVKPYNQWGIAAPQSADSEKTGTPAAEAEAAAKQ